MKFDYPQTKKVVVKDVLHGVELNDAYRWLEDNKDPEVLAWDKAQNEFADRYISQIPFRDKIKDRLLGIMKIDEMSIPQKVLDGERILQYKKNADDEKWILYTQKDANSPLEVLIDPNKWAEDEEIYDYEVSRDGKYIGYSVMKGGNESPVIKIMDIESRNLLSD
ncbi:MAG: hypothetical protein JXN63_09235, partial [Candidatus Delongbacteria bacterium]|nr:hypothetical protein [Candidatus Delongbacteria bacterium]